MTPTDRAKNELIHTELFGKCAHVFRVIRTGPGQVSTQCEKCEVSHLDVQDRDVPDYCNDLVAMHSIIDKMAEIGMYNEERGFWLDIHSPWEPGDKWFGGFTPHGMTGWNGRADYRAEQGSDTMPQAVANAAIAYLDRVKETP
jgi:hypothetical protein